MNHLQFQYLANKKSELQRYKLCLNHPSDSIRRYSQQLDQIEVLLNQLITTQLQHSKHKMKAFAQQLNTLNPLNTLLRGYTACYRKNNEVVQSVSDINIQQLISVKFHDGLTRARVEEIELNELN